MAIEMSFKLHGMQKRSDIVVFSSETQALLIVECKSPEVRITQQVFDQIARYNMKLLVSYLVVTNGLEHFCCRIDLPNKTYHFLDDIPGFTSINKQ